MGRYFFIYQTVNGKRLSPFAADWGRKRRNDDRLVISGIIHVLQSGCRWKDVSEYGCYTTLYNRYNRWSARGIWQYLFREIVDTLSDETDIAALDSTHAKSSPLCRRRKGGAVAQAIGISRGGRNTKVHAISDTKCRPVALYLTPG